MGSAGEELQKKSEHHHVSVHSPDYCLYFIGIHIESIVFLYWEWEWFPDGCRSIIGQQVGSLLHQLRSEFLEGEASTRSLGGLRVIV